MMCELLNRRIRSGRIPRRIIHVSVLMLSAAVLALGPQVGAEEVSQPSASRETEKARETGEREAIGASGTPNTSKETETPMMTFVVNQTPHRGRVVYEDEDVVLLEKPSGASVRYQKDRLSDVKRFVLSLSDYWEEIGDYHMGRIWEHTDSLQDYHKARSAYLKSLGYEDEDAVKLKLGRLEAERDYLQRELIRQQEVAKAEHEAEKARLEKERLEAKLKPMPEFERTVKDYTENLREVRYILRDVTQNIERLQRDLDRLKGRVTDLSYRNRVIIHLRRDYDSLKETIERLQKSLDRSR